MNGFPRKEVVDRVKEQYPKGTRIALVSMDDPYSKLQPGDKGTVEFVDDIGTIFVSWDNGSGLGLAYGEDSCRKLTNEEIEEEQNQEADQDIAEQDMDMSM